MESQKVASLRSNLVQGKISGHEVGKFKVFFCMMNNFQEKKT